MQTQEHQRYTGEVLLSLETKKLVLQERSRTIEDYVARLHLKLVSLQECIDENEREMTRTRNYFSIIYTLPVEILRYIFLLCQMPPHFAQPIWYPLNGSFLGHIPPVHILISQVSTRFRDIVNNAPELWTDIKIDVSNFPSLHKLEEYLKRSTTRPIHLFLHTVKEMCLEELRLTCTPIIPHVHRINTLKLVFKEDVMLGVLLEELKDQSAPMLTSFTVACSDPMFAGMFRVNPETWAAITKEPFTCFLGGAPQLRSINFECVLPGITPWNSGIRRMHFKMPSFRTFKTWLPVLSSFVNLVALSLEDWFFVPMSISNKPFTLPHLRFLKLSGYAGTELKHMKLLFDIVQMPKLESLSVLCQSAVVVANFMYTSSGFHFQELPSLRLLSFWCPTREISKEPQLISRRSPCISNPFESVEQVAILGLTSTEVLLIHLFSPTSFCIPRFPKMKLLAVGANSLDLQIIESVITWRGLAGVPIPRLEVHESFVNPLWGPEIQRFFKTNVNLHTFNPEAFKERLGSLCFPPLEDLL